MRARAKSLAESDHKLSAQAYGWDPTTVSQWSGRRLEWRCERSHIWTAAVRNRSNGNGCPYCSNKKVLAGYNDLATTNQDLAKQAHGWNPTTVTSGSNKMTSWVCKEGHVWEAIVKTRLRGDGCAVCSGHKVLAGFNDLITLRPDLAAQAHGWDPSTVTSGSGEILDWQCSVGHVWPSTVSGRSDGNGCAVCSGHKVLAGFNDLATLRPDLAAQAHGWDPTTLTIGSNKKRAWICDRGHVWTVPVWSRCEGDGCPYCSNKKVLAGYNDLATSNPELANQAHGWSPTTVTAGSHKSVSWMCDKRHVWTATVNDRATKGCPYCSNQLALTGFNDLATTDPELAKQAHGWDSRTVTRGSNKKVEWICDKRHVWTTSVKSRTRGHGCHYCTNRKALKGFNDLSTTDPDLAKQAYGWNPSAVTRFSSLKVDWICNKNHVWKATVNSRSNGHGCWECAERGFDPGKPGWLYFLEHRELNLLQIGISNGLKRRLATHARSGWAHIEVSDEMPGAQAYDYEQGARHAIKARGGVFTDHFGNVKTGGYSEIWTRDSLRIESLTALIAMVDEDRKKRAA